MKKNNPDIRFKNYTGAWELRKVNDIFKVTRGQVLAVTETSEKQSTEMPYPVYSSQTKNDGLMGYYNNYLFDTAITWTTDGANAGTVNYRKGKFYSTNVNGVLLSSAGFANKAIAEILNREAWKWVSHVGNPKLMNNVMGNISLPIPPSLEEHNRLAEFFTSLDELITLHQRELENYKLLKKGFLQKLFPVKGAVNPAVRFEGFTDAWEQRKLGEVGETFTGLSGKTKDDFGQGDAKFVTYMNVFSNAVSDLEMVDSVKVDAKQNSVEHGDVFFTTSSETPEEVGMSSVWLGTEDNVYLNSFCFGYRPDKLFNSYYLAFMLRSPEIRKKFMFLAQGISRYNISKTKAMDIEVPVPKIEEQTNLGDFFKNLDNLITLHQRELESYKELKKGFLQKMFV